MPDHSPIKEPIFLFGTTRSGTTLLSLMLGHHPDIAFAGELEWVWDFHESSDDLDLQAYCDWLSLHRIFLHYRLHFDRTFSFENLVRSFFEQMRSNVDPKLIKKQVGVQVHRHYAKAVAIWPNAKLVHIVRDGRDVCASWLKLGWLGNSYVAGLRWQRALDEWATVKALVDPARTIELRYEDLLQQPEQELTRLCVFAGTSYSDSMMRYHEDTTYEPLNAAESGKWRKQLSTRSVRRFEAAASQNLVDHGYALSGEPLRDLSSWSKLLFKFEDKVLHHFARARVYGPKLWLADTLSRQLPIRSAQARVRLALNKIEAAKIK